MSGTVKFSTQSIGQPLPQTQSDALTFEDRVGAHKTTTISVSTRYPGQYDVHTKVSGGRKVPQKPYGQDAFSASVQDLMQQAGLIRKDESDPA